jgi:hypothetical protein
MIPAETQVRLSRPRYFGRALSARAIVVILLAVCAACGGNGVRGEYKSDDGVVFNFKPNGKVEVTMSLFGMKGATQEMDYAVEDGKIMLGTADQPRTVMPIDEDGCFVFNAGLMGGKMCKSDSKEAKQKVTTNPLKDLAGVGAELDGRYASQDGTYQLEFTANHKVIQTTPDGWSKLDYAVNGDKVNLLLESGTVVAAIDNDGCLLFGGRVRVCKQSPTSLR